MKLKIDKVCYWVDAVSVLHMINNMDKRLKVFVANRLALIHDYSKINEWRYFPSSLNVADVGSRPLLGRRGVEWKYSPARSPHQSGLWEVMIREIKVLLKSIYNDVAYRTLNDEEF